MAVVDADASAAEDVHWACLTESKRKEAMKAAAPATSEGGDGVTGRSSGWTQEYHDYFCSKEQS